MAARAPLRKKPPVQLVQKQSPAVVALPEKKPPDHPLAALLVHKVKKPRVKKVKLPPRMRVRWCIYDSAMKPVAMFDYNQHAAAQERLSRYLEKKPSYFLQLVKDRLPLPEELFAAK